MTGDKLEIMVTPGPFSHAVSPRVAGEAALALEQSGVVDYYCAFEQLSGLTPRTIWNTSTTPNAELLPDSDSFPDAFQLVAFAAAATRSLGIGVTTDSLRRGPAELMQAMLTLANATEGNAVLMMGAGEVKQTKPFGHKRSQGLARLEDQLRLFHMLLDCEEPFDFEGNFYQCREAYVGTVRPHRPKIWAMGGGPQLIELAAKYADGLCSWPGGYLGPDQWSETVAKVKEALMRNGRNVEDFTFGMWFMPLVHEDPAMVEKGLENPLVKYFAASCGKLNQQFWEEEGMEPVYPPGWHYAQKLLPLSVSKEEAEDAIARTTRDHVLKSYPCGSPKEVAVNIQDWVSAGLDQVILFDMLPIALTAEEGSGSLDHVVEICRHLKERNA